MVQKLDSVSTRVFDPGYLNMISMNLEKTLFRSLVTCVLTLVLPLSLRAEEPDPTAVFEQRIMPIFNSPDPSSCVQCHLSAVDLKDYILPSSRETFLNLRDQGLVDVERPAESKILHLIAMGESDPDSLAQRIHAKNRAAEYEAFTAWIASCCADEELVASEPASDAPSGTSGPSVSDEVIRHTRKDRVLDSFTRNIWSQRMRCFPCHTPGELDKNNPMHKKPIQRYNDFVAKYGARMNVFQDTPAKTLRSLIASSRKPKGAARPLIDVQDPAKSLLLLKPTAKLPPKGEDGKIGKPSSAIPVSHMGGIKMHKDDHSYKAFLAWLQDYAKTVNGVYTDAETLPEDNWYPTEHVLRVKGLPEDWPKLTTVQLFLYPWDDAAQAWDTNPLAFTQSKITPRRFVNGTLFAFAPAAGSSEFAKLSAPEKLQLRVYHDSADELATEPTKLLNTRQPDAVAVVQAKFGMGFKNADIVEGDQLDFQ